MVDSLDFNTILNRMAADLKKDELVIPSMPELVATLSKQINNPNITVKELANIISSDTSVSSQLIRLSQTLRYSNPGTTITSLPNAISRIGLNSSTSISLALAIEQTFEFKDEKLQAFCKTKFLYANILCRLALTMCKLKYSFVTPVAADFVILSSALLNIGVLPFIGALDNYIRDSEKEFDINTKIVNDYIKKIKDTLAIAILRHWKFDKAFENVVTFKFDNDKEFYFNAISYANSFMKYALENKIEVEQPKDVIDSYNYITDEEFLDILKNWLSDK